ncbi:MAG: class II fructose-bisphosphate aldolase [Pseudomonadota bacterium]
MSLATLADVLQPAYGKGGAVAGLVCLGWEDMRAYAQAAEAENSPVILQAGPSCRAHTPLAVLGPMMRWLADSVSVPVVVHLDHGYTREECEQAIAAGFTSVMFDGSRLPLEENIEQTRAIAKLAHSAGVSCEGEIGFVGYAGGAQSNGTDPQEAAQFARETGVDAVAISVGNVHLQTDASEGLDEERISAIEAVTDVPLVIHGGSGVPTEQRARLARETAICKFNIGTQLRQQFGRALRQSLADQPDAYDRVTLMKPIEEPIFEAAREVLKGLRGES